MLFSGFETDVIKKRQSHDGLNTCDRRFKFIIRTST